MPAHEIISKYVQATTVHQESASDESMDVEIQASVPKLKETGRLQALRIISRLGRITYRVVAFQGSNLIKNEVIARFLQAEQQGQGNDHLAVTPANYKFKLRYEVTGPGNSDVYVFSVTPRSKQVGLYKGEFWLDAHTYLPVLERGRLVKTPSVFFKKVDFRRDFSIANGRSIPRHMNSTIGVRLIGNVELDVSYSNYNSGLEPIAGTSLAGTDDSL